MWPVYRGPHLWCPCCSRWRSDRQEDQRLLEPLLPTSSLQARRNHYNITRWHDYIVCTLVASTNYTVLTPFSSKMQSFYTRCFADWHHWSVLPIYMADVDSGLLARNFWTIIRTTVDCRWPSIHCCQSTNLEQSSRLHHICRNFYHLPWKTKNTSVWSFLYN